MLEKRSRQGPTFGKGELNTCTVPGRPLDHRLRSASPPSPTLRERDEEGEIGSILSLGVESYWLLLWREACALHRGGAFNEIIRIIRTLGSSLLGKELPKPTFPSIPEL